MCVIIAAPKGKQIPIDHLQNANSANPHGWGMAIRYPTGIEVVRGFTTKSLVREYKKALKNPNMGEVVFHARIGTGGSISLDNTHPYEITKDFLLFHNGILSDVKRDINPKKSDTWHYAKILEPLVSHDPFLFEDDDFRKHINDYAIKQASKFVVMDVWGKTWIFNPEAGVTRDDIWYSNHSAFGRRFAALANPYNYGAYNSWDWDGCENYVKCSDGTWRAATHAAEFEKTRAAQSKSLGFVQTYDKTTGKERLETFEAWKARTQSDLSKSGRKRRRRQQRGQSVVPLSQYQRLRQERGKNANLLDEVHAIMGGLDAEDVTV